MNATNKIPLLFICVGCCDYCIRKFMYARIIEKDRQTPSQAEPQHSTSVERIDLTDLHLNLVTVRRTIGRLPQCRRRHRIRINTRKSDRPLLLPSCCCTARLSVQNYCIYSGAPSPPHACSHQQAEADDIWTPTPALYLSLSVFLCRISKRGSIPVVSEHHTAETEHTCGAPLAIGEHGHRIVYRCANSRNRIQTHTVLVDVSLPVGVLHDGWLTAMY